MSIKRGQKSLLKQIETTWAHHPDWTLGKLLQSANDIALGEFRTNPAYSRHNHLTTGLKALIPEGSEA